MLTDEQREALISKIERVREDLVNDSIADIYARNPFWVARYGEASIKRSKIDEHYNLNYLISSIRMDMPTILTDYYRWLRGILVYRGMCSEHLRDSLEITGEHLVRLLPEQWGQIEPYHRAGYDGLAYDHPGCQLVMAHRDEIAQATATRLFDAEVDEAARAKWVRDNVYYLSYLTDAVGMDSEAIFQNHIEWVVKFLGEQNVQPEALFEDLRVLGDEISASLPEEHTSPFVNLLKKSIPA